MKHIYIVVSLLLLAAACGPIAYPDGYRDCKAGEKPAYTQPSNTLGGASWPICKD